MNILKILLNFARIRVTTMLYALSFLGAASGGEISSRIVFVFPLLITWYIHATTINDYADYEIDKINLKQEKDRPLLTSNLTKVGLWRIHILSLFATVLLSLPFGIKGVILTILLLTIDYVYSLRPLRISDRGIFAQYSLAGAYVYFPLTLGYWSSPMANTYPWVLSIGLYCAFVARLLLKDYRDVRGDSKHGKMTFLLRHGTTTTIYTSIGFWVLSIGLVNSSVSFAYGVVIPSLAGLLQGYLFLKVLGKTKDTIKQQNSITFIAKTANALIMTLLAYLLTRNQSFLSGNELFIIPLTTGAILLSYNWFRYTTIK